MPPTAALYRGYRFPGTIISPSVWLYFRYNLSLREGCCQISGSRLTLPSRALLSSLGLRSLSERCCHALPVLPV
jgi:hypothetical protein